MSEQTSEQRVKSVEPKAFQGDVTKIIWSGEPDDYAIGSDWESAERRLIEEGKLEPRTGKESLQVGQHGEDCDCRKCWDEARAAVAERRRNDWAGRRPNYNKAAEERKDGNETVVDETNRVDRLGAGISNGSGLEMDTPSPLTPAVAEPNVQDSCVNVFTDLRLPDAVKLHKQAAPALEGGEDGFEEWMSKNEINLWARVGTHIASEEERGLYRRFAAMWAALASKAEGDEIANLRGVFREINNHAMEWRRTVDTICTLLGIPIGDPPFVLQQVQKLVTPRSLAGKGDEGESAREAYLRSAEMASCMARALHEEAVEAKGTEKKKLIQQMDIAESIAKSIRTLVPAPPSESRKGDQ